MSSLPAISKLGVGRYSPIRRRWSGSSRTPGVTAGVTSGAMTGMMLALAVLAREPFLICLRQLFTRQHRKTAAEQAVRLLSLPSLRSAIIGQSCGYVKHLFGPPPTATQGQYPVWYYPVSAADRVAMAISFHDGRAAIVEFFQSPQLHS